VGNTRSKVTLTADNLVAAMLLDGTSSDMAVDGSLSSMIVFRARIEGIEFDA
jgi:hypothetical protein